MLGGLGRWHRHCQGCCRASHSLAGWQALGLTRFLHFRVGPCESHPLCHRPKSRVEREAAGPASFPTHRCNPFLHSVPRSGGHPASSTGQGQGASVGWGNKASGASTWKAWAVEGAEGDPVPWRKSDSPGLREEDCHGKMSLGHPIRVETSPTLRHHPQRWGGHRGLSTEMDWHLGTITDLSPQ